MDMAPRREALGLAGDDRPAGRGCPSGRALDALRDTTQATMMMALVWPAIAAMPFFWAPPLWVMFGLVARRRPSGPR